MVIVVVVVEGGRGFLTVDVIKGDLIAMTSRLEVGKRRYLI